METKEQLWERLAPVVLEREQGFGDITVGGATDQQGKDNLLNFIFQELDRAREEGKIEYIEELYTTNTTLDGTNKICGKYTEDSGIVKDMEEDYYKYTGRDIVGVVLSKLRE